MEHQHDLWQRLKSVRTKRQDSVHEKTKEYHFLSRLMSESWTASEKTSFAYSQSFTIKYYLNLISHNISPLIEINKVSKWRNTKSFKLETWHKEQLCLLFLSQQMRKNLDTYWQLHFLFWIVASFHFVSQLNINPCCLSPHTTLIFQPSPFASPSAAYSLISRTFIRSFS